MQIREFYIVSQRMRQIRGMQIQILFIVSLKFPEIFIVSWLLVYCLHAQVSAV